MSAFDLKDKGSENASGSLCVNLTGATSTGWKQIEPNGNKWKQMETNGTNGTNGNKWNKDKDKGSLCVTLSTGWKENSLFMSLTITVLQILLETH